MSNTSYTEPRFFLRLHNIPNMYVVPDNLPPAGGVQETTHVDFFNYFVRWRHSREPAPLFCHTLVPLIDRRRMAGSLHP